jgi:hypothetical protein
MAAISAYNPDEIIASDRGSLLPMLGLLGPQVARLGGTAFATAANAASAGRMLKRWIQERDDLMSQAESEKEFIEATSSFEYQITEAANKAVALARDAADLLEDALNSGPSWLLILHVDFSQAKSRFGKRLHDEMEKKHKGKRFLSGVKARTAIAANKILAWAESDN